MISRRKDGYYISHLEGSKTPRVNNERIGGDTRLLRDGDYVCIGKLELQFFLEGSPAEAPDPKASSTDSAQRTCTRVGFDSAATLTQGDSSWSANVIDISIKGALLTRPDGWNGQQGDAYDLTIHLGEDQVIQMSVSVAHAEEHEIGLHCRQIDIDSITHLRRIVEVNLDGSGLLERELSALA